MYSGYQLLYAIKLYKLDDALLMVGLDPKSDEDGYNKVNQQLDKVNQQLEELGYKHLQLYTLPCCYFGGSWYLGFKVGSTDFVYRDDVSSYYDFKSYHEAQLNQLSELEATWAANKEAVTMELDQFMQMVKPFSERVVQYTPKFYTFANDCGNCT